MRRRTRGGGRGCHDGAMTTPETPRPASGRTAPEAPTTDGSASIGHLTEAGVLARIVPVTAEGCVDGARAGSAPEGPRVEVGPGDDAAVVRLASPRLVVSTDTLTEGEDFLLDATCGEWIGAKAAVQNLADIAAMGARPSALVVAVTAPAQTPIAQLEDVSRALSARAARDGAPVVGGDLGAGPVLSLTVTALGSLPEGSAPVLRSGARAGDVLAIGTERLGRSGAGLAWILAGRAADTRARELVAWHNAPDPDLALGWAGAREEDGTAIASAMLDVSDGLVRDAGRIARASGVVIDLDHGALAPDAEALADAARALDADAWEWVLHGGEEHAMLATFPADRVPMGFRRIGAVRALSAGESPRVLLDGAAITHEGFDHFA